MGSSVDPEDREEIRFAVVMNGGVSLAVWISGVTNEINRLVLSKPDPSGPYGPVLQAVQSEARVDVISGASAGGINGAFLGLALAYGGELKALGELWAREAAFLELLRPAKERNPPSILNGNLFLEKVEAALEGVLPEDPQKAYRSPADVPIDLSITASLVEGEELTFVDDYDSAMTQVNHRGVFRFVRKERTPREEDPFARPHDVCRKLALAARSTASFPAAFEPSFVPVSDSPAVDRSHPDMADIADFRKSKFVLDGGILVNKPIAPALEAISDRLASRQVRRVLAYVNPDPQPDVEVARAKRDQPPSLSAVLAKSLVTLPSAQSVHAELREIKSLNRQVREYKASRLDLIRVLGDRMADLSDALFSSYQEARRRRAIQHIAGILIQRLPKVQWEKGCPGGRQAAAAEVGPDWTWEELIEAFRDAEFNHIARYAPRTSVTLDMSTWGISPLERISDLAIDTLRRALWLVPIEDADLRRRLREARDQLHKLVESVRAFRRDADEKFWLSEARCGVPPPPTDPLNRLSTLHDWAGEALRLWPTPRAGADTATVITRSEELDVLNKLADAIVRLLAQEGPALRAAVEAGRAYGLHVFAAEADTLEAVLDYLLGPSNETTDPRECMRRLLELEVCQVSFAGTPPVTEQEVKLIQVSGSTASSFTGPMSASKKLAGAQLGHFGAFYKESWRVSDWIWGRVDGATRLCLAVLGPARLQQLMQSTGEAVKLIRRLAVETGDEDDCEFLGREFDREACSTELAYLDDQTRPVPSSLPHCAMALARRLHLEILRTELPRLREAVEHDLDVRHSYEAAGLRFLRKYDQSPKREGGQLRAEAAFGLFGSAEVGSERVTDDLGSDMLAKTLAQTAAVSVSAISSETNSLKGVRSVMRALRGITLALYALVWSATVDSAFGRTVVNLALAIGGASVAVALLAKDAPPLVGVVGVTLLLAGLGLAALRARLPLYALVVGVFVILLTAGAIYFAGDWRAVLRQLLLVGIVAAVVLVAMLLGAIGTSTDKQQRGKKGSRSGT